MTYNYQFILIPITSFLYQIVWENRKRLDTGDDCLVSVDCTDFMIVEPYPFRKGWYSQKFCGPGLRYEVAVSLKKGDIVWLNGPYECGVWPDVKIFRDSFISFLDPFERVEADDGYSGEQPKTCKTPGGFASRTDNVAGELRNRIRSRHETVNARLKNFGALKQVYRHSLLDHGAVLRAVAILCQLSFEHGEPLFTL